MLQLQSGFVGALTAAFGIAVLLYALSLLWRKSEWLMQKIFAIPALSDDVGLVEDKPFREGQVEGVSEHIPGAIEKMQDYYETPLSKESVELIAFSVVGLWATFSYLPRLLSVLVGYFDSSSALSRLTGLYSISTICGDVIPIILGLWLFLRPWQFQGWIEKLKPKAASTDEIAN